MENNRMDVNRWSDARLATLEPDAEWRPDAAGALRKFHRRRRVRTAGKGSAFLLSAAALAVFVLGDLTPRACAYPSGCSEEQAKAAPASQPAGAGYKQSGNPSAPVTIEIYSDYQCPACAYFYKETMPLIDATYVKTGKVRIVHRDLPLPMHAYAKLAARYANAAGEMGRYDAVTDRLYRSSESWGVNGDITGALAGTLSVSELIALQHAVEGSDARLDATLASDLELAEKAGIHGTPTLIIISKAGRQPITQMPSFATLKAYIDLLVSK
jgi:protein-disulfide isomerase